MPANHSCCTILTKQIKNKITWTSSLLYFTSIPIAADQCAPFSPGVLVDMSEQDMILAFARP